MHYDIELPTEFAFGLEGGAAYQTQIATVSSGYEFSNTNLSAPLREYTVSYPPQLKNKYERLIDFFEVIAKGKQNSFLLKDPLDFQVSQSQGVFAITPSIEYQCYKRRAVGAVTEDRLIQKLRSGTVTVYDAGTPMVSGFSIDYSTGIITITSGSGPYTWSGEFCVPVRFDSDPMKSAIVQARSRQQFVIEWRSIPLVEKRL